ncbi:AAA family ATPase [Halococcus saccharolyticus]|uniref:SMC domain protein n=1 Tax=Halococcus saccharolyticus DSM 5350 TaxID=1227455 RepID=M0MM64_9EURY|nr:AAA family ATPase [Halococcus saccharolyticus]EMA45829.1 SMC domain protein [Halococcus saccharolyticus DSM 5350]
MTLVFNQLRLENIRSYDDQTVTFERGENLIFGANGAGKSTILQGVFGGLFQTAIKYQVGTDFDLPDLVRKQADEGRLVLTFEAGGEEYTVDWRIEKTYDDGEVDGAKTKSGYPQLSSPALDEDISQVGTVQEEIRRIIGMDAESFVNSVYVQQGDITRLIHADTETRREILDGLLGLHHLDDLVDRMDAVRLEYGKAERDAKAKRTETRNRLDEFPERDEIQAEIAETAERISDKKDDVADNEDELESLRELKSDNEETLDRIDDLESDLEAKREKLADAEDDHERHKESLEAEQAARREAESTFDEKREALDELREHNATPDDALRSKEAAESAYESAQSTAESARASVQSIEEGTLSTLAVEIETLDEAITETRDDIDEVEETLELAGEKKATGESHRTDAEERAERLETDLDETKADIADRADELDIPRDASLRALAQSHIPEKRRTVSEERETVREERGRLETLQGQVDELAAESECPVCGASEDAHDIDTDAVAEEHAAALVEKNERLDKLEVERERLDALERQVTEAIDLRDDLDDARETASDAQDDIDEAEATIEECESELESLQEELAERQDEREEKREEKQAAEAELETARERVVEAETTERLVGRAVDLYENIDDIEGQVSQHEQNIENVRELRRQAHDRVRDLEADVEVLEDELGDANPDDLRAEIAEIEELVEEIHDEKAEAEAHIENLTGRLAELNQTKRQLQDERERVAMLDDQVTWAAEHHEEAAAVMEKYREVRGKLRERNLAKLNQYTNEMFGDLYQSQSYRGVRIDKKYNIHLIAADGELIEPELSSGGESTILNLALRAGVYRIIAQRDGVAGSALPPFILDEPTTYLDDDHVGELQTMIETISDWNVPQVLVVSHDETLIENSDHTIFVEKDPATETSRVRTSNASPSPQPNEEAEAADD